MDNDLRHLILGFMKIVSVGDGLGIIFFLLAGNQYQQQIPEYEVASGCGTEWIGKGTEGACHRGLVLVLYSFKVTESEGNPN